MCNLLIKSIVRSGLIDGHSHFIEAGDLKNPLASVIVDIVVVKSRHYLAKSDDVMESDTIAGEIIAVNCDLLVWSRLTTFNFQTR